PKRSARAGATTKPMPIARLPQANITPIAESLWLWTLRKKTFIKGITMPAPIDITRLGRISLLNSPGFLRTKLIGAKADRWLRDLKFAFINMTGIAEASERNAITHNDQP